MRRTLHSEWTKLRTMPSAAWLCVAAVVLNVGLGSAVVAAAAPGATSCAGTCDIARLSLSGVYLGQTAVVVLAVLAMSSEFDTGLIAPTLVSDPRRIRVLVAKAAVVTATALGTGVLAVAGSLATGRILSPGGGFTPANGYPPLSLLDGATMRAAVGTVLYLGLIALFSMGIATVRRDTTSALVTVLGLLYLAPLLGMFAPDEQWRAAIDRYAPMPAGLAVQATANLGDLPIGPWLGLGVLAAYAGAAMVLGAARFAARDA